MAKDLHIQPRAFMPAYGLDAPFADLMKLDPADEALAETFRIKHCQVCRQSSGDSPLDRARACAEADCGWRDPEHLAAEREWLNYITQVLWHPNTARQEAVDLFNNYLLTTRGGRVPLLGTYGTGRHGLTFYNRTFRAAAQQAALLILAHRAGDRHMNIAGDTQDRLIKLVVQWTREYQDELKHLVATLRNREEPISWSKILNALGPDAPSESTLKDWYNEVAGRPPSARRRKGRDKQEGG